MNPYRSAGFQPAVSQISNLLRLEISDAAQEREALAEFNSAIQQITNLRYAGRLA
jgi:hypothetical protein